MRRQWSNRFHAISFVEQSGLSIELISIDLIAKKKTRDWCKSFKKYLILDRFMENICFALLAKNRFVE